MPIISAVGHETDFTICDFVSDMRAPTPSAAAEISVPDVRDLMMRIDLLSDRSDRALKRLAERMRDRLDLLVNSQVITNSSKLTEHLRQKLDVLAKDACTHYCNMLSDNKNMLAANVAKLEALNPLSVLARGYSVVSKNDSGVYSIDDVSVGDVLSVRLKDGVVESVVKGTVKRGTI